MISTTHGEVGLEDLVVPVLVAAVFLTIGLVRAVAGVGTEDVLELEKKRKSEVVTSARRGIEIQFRPSGESRNLGGKFMETAKRKGAQHFCIDLNSRSPFQHCSCHFGKATDLFADR